MIGQFFDTMIVASSNIESGYNDPSESKCWKLFVATLNSAKTTQRIPSRCKLSVYQLTDMPMKVRFRSTRLKTLVISLSPYVTFDKLLLWALKTADDLCKVSAMLHIASYAKEENALAGKFILWLFLISSLLSSTAVWKQKDSMIKQIVNKCILIWTQNSLIFRYTSYGKCHSLTGPVR